MPEATDLPSASKQPQQIDDATAREIMRLVENSAHRQGEHDEDAIATLIGHVIGRFPKYDSKKASLPVWIGAVVANQILDMHRSNSRREKRENNYATDFNTEYATPCPPGPGRPPVLNEELRAKLQAISERLQLTARGVVWWLENHKKAARRMGFKRVPHFTTIHRIIRDSKPREAA